MVFLKIKLFERQKEKFWLKFRSFSSKTLCERQRTIERWEETDAYTESTRYLDWVLDVTQHSLGTQTKLTMFAQKVLFKAKLSQNLPLVAENIPNS